MARTRQKSKQRKAKRLEQEQQKGGGRTPAQDAAAAVDEAISGDPSPQEGGLAAAPEPEAAAEQVAPRRSRGRTAAAEKEPARAAAKAPAKDAERARKRPARAERSTKQRPADRRQAGQRNRLVNFFIQVWAELRRVQWPTRSQVTQATAVVVVFCFIAGLYLALWDFVFARLVKVLL